MSNARITVDNARVKALLDELSLTNKETRTAFRGGIRKAAALIQKQARQNLDGVINEASGTRLSSKNLKRWVRLTVYKSSSGARVDVMGKPRKKNITADDRDYKEFIIRFFAIGTKPRYTKSHTRSGHGENIKRTGRGGYRGRIGNSQFFAKAVDSKQKAAEQSLEQSIVDHINKVVKKRR